ncbi:hypothetical protein LCGC14_1756180 [marine sediment metagenome]|uniref:Uncharacterized protein n=1 Tax=marine sediment metagenome TaxID=412755 RepID=A0A0F9H2G4_9ZZZZ
MGYGESGTATMTPIDGAESEWQTRKKRIDPKLEASGWHIRPAGDAQSLLPGRYALEEFPTGSGPADYVLTADGQFLGVVEAKRVTLGPENVLTQAERYARGMGPRERQYNGFGVPFLYSTNGEVI